MLSESIVMPTVSGVNLYVHVNGRCSDVNPKQSAAENETNPSSVESSHIEDLDFSRQHYYYISKISLNSFIFSWLTWKW